MEISYCTGIRQGDLLKMSWKDIGETLYIEEGKTDREYLKTVSPRLKYALDQAKRLPGHPFGGWVIRNNSGNRYTAKGFQATWKKVKARSPVDFRWHDIRHKAISDASTGKKQAFSMHRDAKMLGIYDHQLPVSPSH
jgi:integrase